MRQNIQLRRHCHASSKPDLVETLMMLCSGEAFHLEHRRVRGSLWRRSCGWAGVCGPADARACCSRRRCGCV